MYLFKVWLRQLQILKVVFSREVEQILISVERFRRKIFNVIYFLIRNSQKKNCLDRQNSLLNHKTWINTACSKNYFELVVNFSTFEEYDRKLCAWDDFFSLVIIYNNWWIFFNFEVFKKWSHVGYKVIDNIALRSVSRCLKLAKMPILNPHYNSKKYHRWNIFSILSSKKTIKPCFLDDIKNSLKNSWLKSRSLSKEEKQPQHNYFVTFFESWNKNSRKGRDNFDSPLHANSLLISLNENKLCYKFTV